VPETTTSDQMASPVSGLYEEGELSEGFPKAIKLALIFDISKVELLSEIVAIT